LFPFHGYINTTVTNDQHKTTRASTDVNERIEKARGLFSKLRKVWLSTMRWAGHVMHMEEERGVHRVLVGKPEGTRPLGRPRHRWEDNINMDVQKVEGGCGDWMELAQDRDRWQARVR
jgi:hypothetical protein